MKPNMLKKWSVALLVAAGAAGLVGCNANQGGKKDAEAAALTEAEVPTDTENFDTGLTARSLSLVQADVDQSMGDVISPISGALHVLDGHYDTVNQNWTDHQNGGSASLLANEGDRLNLVYNAIRDRFDGIYDNTGAAEVRTDVATVTIQNVVKGSTYSVTVTSDAKFSQSNAATSTGSVVANADGMEDVEASVSITADDNLRYTLGFEAVASGDANIDLKNVAGGYTVTVSENGGDAVSLSGGSLKDDFAPLVALQHADRNGQDKTNYNNSIAPHDSIGMLIEYGEQTTDEAGEQVNGNAQEFYPKLNLTASLYDACMKRGKSENIDVSVSDGQEPINASEQDLSYYTTPLLAKSVNSGSCPTESSVGKTCSTARSDRFYNNADYTCWEGAAAGATCRYVYADPGADVTWKEVVPVGAADANGNYADFTVVTAGANSLTDTAGSRDGSGTLDLLTNAALSAVGGWSFSQTVGTEDVFGIAATVYSNVSDQSACEPVPANTERAIVIDLTDDLASITGGSTVNAVQTSYSGGNIATGSSLLSTGDGLLYLETPGQYSTRSGKTVSERTHHVIASLGDWRTIDENSRFIGSSQDVVRGDTATLYGPRMELIVNNNVYGPVSGDSAVTSYHFGLRAEDYVVDAESDGAVKGSLMKLTGEKDAANTNLAVGSGDATGVVFVDATPPLNTQTSTVASGGAANNRNNDGSITLAFDQPVLAAASYPEHAYLDLVGENFVYRVDMNSGTMVRGRAIGDSVANYLNGVSGTLDVDESSIVDTDNNADSKLKVGAENIDMTVAGVTDIYAGSKIQIKDVDPGYVTNDTVAGSNTISLSGLENGIIAEGSIIQIGNGERAHRYRIVDNTDGDGYVTVASGTANFVITPALRGGVSSGRDVTVEKSSTHHVTEYDNDMSDVTIYPSVPSNYGNGATVTILNGIDDSLNSAYTDIFGFSTAAFPAQSVAVTTSLSADLKTMTITLADTVTADAAVADNVNSAGTDITSETVDLGAFLSDLSHTSTNSKDAVAADANGNALTPSFFVNYEDIQDTNFNSWAKTDEYDNYDNGRSPLIVGVDGIGPKLVQEPIGATADSTNTFLYDVTDEVSFSLAAAHGNHQLLTDDDVIYTPGVDSATRDTNTLQSGGNDIAFDADNGGGTMTVDVDYPLFWFWNHNTTTSATGNAENTSEIADVRAVLKLSGVTTIDTSITQAYIYAPEAVETDQRTAAGAADTDAYPQLASFDDCGLTEESIDNYILATPKVSGIRHSASLGGAGAGTYYGTDNPQVSADAGAADNSVIHTLVNSSDVLNVDANDNVNVLTDNGQSALIVGIENYGGHNWDSTQDTLVMEDVFLDGVPYTLHFKIPQVTTADITNTTYVTAETANLPVMHVYRKVSLASVDLMPSGKNDMCSPRNVRSGQLVNSDYDPDSLSFSFREQISGTPTVTWYTGSDLDEPATATNDTTNGITTDFTGEVVTMDSTKTVASIRLGDQTEITESFIGHDAQFTVTASDFAGNSSGFTVTLRLGHGAEAVAATGITGTGAIDEDNSDGAGTVGAAVVVDPILNIIGPLDNNKHVSAAQTGDGTAVE